MNILYVIVPAVIMILCCIYLYYYIGRLARFFGVDIKSKRAKWILIALSLVIIYYSLRDFGVGLIIQMHVLGIAAIMDLINIILRKIENKRSIEFTRWSKVYRSGLLPLILAAAILGYGYYNMNHIVEKDYTIYTNKDIRDEGYRVAMISDLHYGTSLNKEKLQNACREIDEKEPDIIVLCGDIVDEKTTLSQMKEALEVLGNMKSRYGIFYVYGNHDDSKYISDPEFTKDELKEELESNGIHVLADKSYEVNDDLVIIGREDEGFSKDKYRKSGESLLEGVDKSKFLLLLDHQPLELNENSEFGYDLQLSGHTHKGQIWPGNIISSLFGFNELEYGYEKINDYQIIVSSGISGWNYPIRTGSDSEYLIVDIINSKYKNQQ